MPKIELEHHELPYAVAEELNTLRTNVQFSGEEKRVIMVTSCISGDGKSTISLELARSLASLNLKVLLVDVDLRKSQMRKHVTAGEITYGLSHYLAGRNGIEDILYETETKLMHVIPAGRNPPNPSELLSGERFGALIEWGRKNYDYVIVDCPPLGVVVDAAVVSQHCDGSIFVITAGQIHRRMAQEVAAKLRSAKCPIMGVVLNKIDEKANSYYNYYYYRYGYGYGYREKYGASTSRRRRKANV